MITELSREELVALGSRMRADYLIEQAGYTLGLAALDGDPLAALLAEGYLAEVRLVLDDLNRARQDRAVVEAESKDARRTHSQAFAEAKVWRRAVARRATLARRMGKNIPDGLLRVANARTPQALAAQVVDMVRLLEENLEQIQGAGKAELVAQGRALADALQSTDANQEVKRLAELPDAVKRFYEKKGTLYIGLKVINDAGQALHAADSSHSARYNLSILYRRGGSRAAAQPPQPAP